MNEIGYCRRTAAPFIKKTFPDFSICGKAFYLNLKSNNIIFSYFLRKRNCCCVKVRYNSLRARCSLPADYNFWSAAYNSVLMKIVKNVPAVNSFWLSVVLKTMSGRYSDFD